MSYYDYDWEMIIDLAYKSYEPGSDATVSPNGVVDIPMNSEYPFLKMAVARRLINEDCRA